MKQEFSQMAFDFPMEAEPQAPLRNGLSSHHGESGSGASDNGLVSSGNGLAPLGNSLVPGNGLAPPGNGLSEAEEHVVREEGRRAGVVVRIKSIKRPSEQPIADLPANSPATATPVAPIQAKAPEKIFVQASIPLEEVDLPVVKAEIPAPIEVSEAALIAIASPIPIASQDLATSQGPADLQVPAANHAAVAGSVPANVSDPAVSLADVAYPVPADVPNPAASLASPVPAESPTPTEAPLPKRSNRAKPAPAERVKSKRGRKSLKDVAAEADLIDIPADEVLFSKQYYTMGEVAGMFHVNQSLLRFWENEFSILQPRKNRKGDRYFRPIDIKNLHLIYYLLRQRKYTIEGAKEFLRKNKNTGQQFEAIQKLQQIKAFLLELKAQL